ncbi:MULTISPECIES: high-potential iron-sulfur protein [Microbulbifer]|uniref:high-potential iron-sulfur protein n=1 Tax=Microbulbifer TaxID=48073 RepID=UPI001E49397C|nr:MULTISPECIES: high-potential iron-sulfur protein [Microbulbifer]UHQ54703.1 high-potential iron-sulfur protein [Microbulbifer sp. YPW16]
MSNEKRDISRRKFLKLSGCAAILLPAAIIATDRTVAQGKASKEAVKYQDSPKDGQKCKDCQFWTDPNACQVVEGEISPEGWCNLYVKKQ